MFFPEYDIVSFTDPRQALVDAAKIKKKIDILIVDYRMPGMSGLDFLIAIKKMKIFKVKILLTAFADREILEDTINQGLIDKIVEKPIDMEVLKELIDEEIENIRAFEHREREIFLLKSKYDEIIERINYDYSFMVGKGTGLKDLYARMNDLKDSFQTALITGEFGTGKEVVARTLHNLSSRNDKPFVKTNCKILPDNSLELDLFGFKRGDSARIERVGKILQAKNGTLYIEEVGDIREDMQLLLIDLLKKRTYFRLGDNKESSVACNFIFSTTENLIEKVASGDFKSELYDLISENTLIVPPLRERKVDIPDLVGYIIEKHCKNIGVKTKLIDESALLKLTEYDWPGNVRELENVIERGIVLSKDRKSINSDCFEYLVAKSVSLNNYEDAISVIRDTILDFQLNLSDVENDILKNILSYFDGNILTAVSKTSISKNKFYRRIK